MMNWDHLQDLSKDELIARVIHGEEQQSNWEKVYKAQRQELERVKGVLKLVNDSCRSAYQVAARKGIDTNWETLQFSLQKSLKEQHRVMYPEQYTDEKRIHAHDSAAHPKDAP